MFFDILGVLYSSAPGTPFTFSSVFLTQALCCCLLGRQGTRLALLLSNIQPISHATEITILTSLFELVLHRERGRVRELISISVLGINWQNVNHK